MKKADERKGGLGRAALIGAGVLGGAAVGARTLPRLLPKGRVAQAGESLLGKVVYNNQGVTTPLEVISIPKVGNLRSVVRSAGRQQGIKGTVARAVEKVDQWAGVPQRHYGVGVGSGRIAEVSKARGRRIVPEESFGKMFVDDEGKILRDRNLPRRAEGRGGTMNEPEVAAFNKRYEQAQQDPRWKRRNVCAAGDTNCEAYARGLSTGKAVSRQVAAMKIGAVAGAAAGGGGVYALTKDMKKNKMMGALQQRVVELGRATKPKGRCWKGCKPVPGKRPYSKGSCSCGMSALTPGMVAFALGEDNRPRNNNGQFLANETGGADPNSMAAAYGNVEAEKMARRQNLMGRLKAMMGR